VAVIILDPRTQPDAAEDLVMVPGPESLAGMRIGLLDNHKRNARRVLEHLAATISLSYPNIQFTYVTKGSSSTGVSPEMLGDLKSSCDLVIAGIGD